MFGIMEKKNIFIGVGALIVLIALVWWGAQSSTPNNAPTLEAEKNNEVTTSPFTPSVVEHPLSQSEVSGAALRVFNVVIAQTGILPTSVTVGKGDRVQFNVKAEDALYDFVVEIPDYEFYLREINEGSTYPVSFQAAIPGTFQFGCLRRCPAEPRFTAQLIVLDR